MIYKIVKDLETLRKVSKPADATNIDLIDDLINTAKSYPICVGLAAIQIGVPLRIILVKMYDKFVPMMNPVILKKYGKRYTAEESCLSLEGTRKVKRHEAIDLAYSKPEQFGVRIHGGFTGLIAQIIQHECDHLDGKLI